jgi:hypothetical protein
MQADPATYPPLDTPKPVAPGVWIVDSGPAKAIGVPLPVRMTAIHLSTGALLLHSPTPFSLQLKKELEQSGPIEHIVAPNSAHWKFLREWQRQIPGVQTWAAPGLRRRPQVLRAGVRLDHDLGDGASKIWSNELDQLIIRGLGGFAEVAFTRAAATLVLTDLVQNFEPEKLPRLIRPAPPPFGRHGSRGKGADILRIVVKLRGQESREAAERLVALRPNG